MGGSRPMAPLPRLARAAAMWTLSLCAPQVAASGLAAQAACAEPSATTGLGVRYRFVSGDFLGDAARPRWVHFFTEPAITGVDPAGPSAGRLREGDVVESVDGALITTLDGSRRFADAGRRGSGEVTLGVRRGGRALEVAVPACGGGAAASGAPDPAAAARGSGWRLRCEDCGYADPGGWHFSAPPVVTAVAADGPAGRAGARAGDRLLAVDGAALGTADGDARFSAVAPGDTVSWTLGRDGARVVLRWVVR